MVIKHNGTTFYSWMDETVSFKEPISFDTLTHVTSLENTEQILQEGLKMQLVGDYSSVNKLKDKQGTAHPLLDTPFIWMAPDTHHTNTAIRYGNVAFSLKNLSKLEQFKFYYIEFLDYVTKTAARIVITRKNWDHLLCRFDPTDESQYGKIPVIFNGSEWMRFSSFSNSRRNKEATLDVEFLLDVTPPEHDLCCSYVKCYNPKPIVTLHGKVRGSVKVYNGNLDVIRLVVLLARYQGFNRFELHQNTFLTDLISTMQSIRCSDHFLPENFLDEQENRITYAKPNHILGEIDFAGIFDVKEFGVNDWKRVQMLDVLFCENGCMPNTQTMLNVLSKAIGQMKSERSTREVFNLFFKTFLSSSAKRLARKSLINLLCTL